MLGVARNDTTSREKSAWPPALPATAAALSRAFALVAVLCAGAAAAQTPERDTPAIPPVLAGSAEGAAVPSEAAAALSETAPPSPVAPAGAVTSFGTPGGVRLSPAGNRKLEAYKRALSGAPGLAKYRDGQRLDESYDDATGRTRVLVLLRMDGALPAEERFGSPEGRSAWRGEVAGAQSAVINGLSSGEVSVDRRYVNIPGIVCDVTAAGLRELLANPDVLSVQPDTLVELHLAQGIPLMNADSLRTLHDGSGLTIAIIDDGVDYTHPDLGNGSFPNSKVIGGIDTGGIGDADPFPGGGNSHGTSVAGIACGDVPGTIINNYIGGVAPGAKIAAVKVFEDGARTTTNADVVEGIDWCVTNQFLEPANPIMIINMSLGGGRYTSASAAAFADPVRLASVNAAVAAGITVIASSGNNGYCDSMGNPAALAPVISVGAVYDANIGTRGWCVNSATCYPGGIAEDCAGTNIAIYETTGAKQVTAYSNTADFLDLFGASNNASTPVTGGSYTSGFGGTSAAAPYVAGVVALLQSAALAETGSFLSPEVIRDLLIASGDPVTDIKGGGLTPGITKPLADAAAAYQTFSSGNVLPVLSVSEPSLSFIAPDAAPEDRALTISNGAAAGGLDLGYSIQTSSEISISSTDIVGSTQVNVAAFTRYRGNIYQALKYGEITEFEMFLNFSGFAFFDFVIYEMDELTDAATKTLVYGEFAFLPSVGPAFYSTGPISVPIEAGKYYIVATGWDEDSVGYYFDGAPQPAVGFGQKVQGFGISDVFPLPTAFTGGLSGAETNYFQRVSGDVPWVSVDKRSGALAPQAGETITVTANTTGFAPGMYTGALTIYSNSAGGSPLNVPVGLLVGLSGHVYVDFGYTGIEFGTMAAPYNTLAEGLEAVAPGPTAQITILNGGSSDEALDLNKEVTITADGGEATVGTE